MMQDVFEQQAVVELPEDIEAGEELAWLMSLALDGELTPEEEARMQELLAADAESAEMWQVWQALDADLSAAPVLEPPSTFGESFNLRLAQWERQQRLRTGVVFGLAAAALWGSALVGMVVLGAFVWSNQAVMMGGLVQQVALWWSAIVHFGETIVETGGELIASPQARLLAGGYVVMAAAILGAWIVCLRRSLREPTLSVQ